MVRCIMSLKITTAILFFSIYTISDSKRYYSKISTLEIVIVPL